ncbi:uncharacterized protein BCR38DRAFT_476517 [Pseudomassariella vexata]|uniref:2EXR domain-containing protein n=1 Tax=Pseudomassariella vexata TaxID=1141098 RepID=A0A1Y2DMV0_9PEZI|nr:uncharacterized protein BCR38DRAFT_476517 [Pseudomassariella vexata]ORY60581.1 hypothetical protein BCR38DRAFT_476517 [Pseudomassariella vexata]
MRPRHDAMEHEVDLSMPGKYRAGIYAIHKPQNHESSSSPAPEGEGNEIVSPPATGDFSEIRVYKSRPRATCPSIKDVTTNMALRFKNLHIGVTFRRFNDLPSEIRCHIWRETWEHRTVTLSRYIYRTVLHGAKYQIEDITAGNESSHRLMRIYASRLVRQIWGINVNMPSKPREYLDTATWSATKPPPSLFINKESRAETLRHYEQALYLAGGGSVCYFNFDLDIVRVPVHNAVGMVLHPKQFKRLQRISIPELSPALSSFANNVGQWDEAEITTAGWTIVPTIEDPPISFPEFGRVWRLLRWQYPNLREINLERFYQCNRYESTKTSRLDYPLDLAARPQFRRISNFDDHCHSCFNIQKAIDQRFPQIINATKGTQLDIWRILDHHQISEPVWRQKKLVIGTLPAENGRNEEKVTVTYWRVHSWSSGGSQVPTRQEEQAERTCVVRSLERVFGAPSRYDYVAYKI